MRYIVKLEKDNVVPLPDPLFSELKLAIGDILVCEIDAERTILRMEKHNDQTLTDEQITAAGNLTRVISLSSEE